MRSTGRDFLSWMCRVWDIRFPFAGARVSYLHAAMLACILSWQAEAEDSEDAICGRGGGLFSVADVDFGRGVLLLRGLEFRNYKQGCYE